MSVSSVPRHGQSSFPLSAERCPVLCTLWGLSIHLLKGVFIAFCQLWVQSCRQHPCLQVFVWTQIFNSFGQIPSSMIPGFYEKSVFSENLPSCLPGWMCCRTCESSFCSEPLSAFVVGVLMGAEWCLIAVLICISMLYGAMWCGILSYAYSSAVYLLWRGV